MLLVNLRCILAPTLNTTIAFLEMNNHTTSGTYQQYIALMQKVADVKYSNAVLQWDQETYLPAKGAEARARQMATLSELAHDMFTGGNLGELLESLQADSLDADQQKNVDLTREEFTKQKKFSSEFVRKMSEAVSTSFYAWIDARKQNDFAVFEPALTRLLELKRQEADILGYEQHPYNAMLNEYEKGATVSELDAVFSEIKSPLHELVIEIQSKHQPNDFFLQKTYPKDKQWEWGLYIAKQLGFDFEAGRQDISEHPFTTNFSSSDVRITTRIDEHDFANMTWSTIHEVGHGLYEQGLPAAMYGLPLGEYASLGIHESQSRLWENCVGRGLEFWNYYLPHLKTYFPEQLADVDTKQFVGAINKVQPSLIRTEADEVTYHFHVMIRYELEKQLIAGSLQVKDIPTYWNEQYKNLLGVIVPDDKHGCLQDVHWSHGSFGYFPTYSLGSFYAAQFWEQAKKELPNLLTEISTTGSTASLLAWLRSKIHLHGKRYTSAELCQLVTGRKLDSAVFIAYTKSKFNEFL
jgi:carboxypeptidase Taq